MIVTSLLSAGSPLGRSMFQSMPKSLRSTVVSMSNASRWIAVAGIRRRADDRPGDRDGLRDAAERELAVDRDLVAIALDRLRGEAQLGEPLGVEEVGRLEVPDELRVVERDARDLGGALELAVDQLGVELLEAAAERARAAVLTAKPTAEWIGSRLQVPVGMLWSVLL